MKPAGYANFNIVFARGKMVLAYSVKGLAAKKLPPIAEAGGSQAIAKWYEMLIMPGVSIGGGNPFLDPGAYRGLGLWRWRAGLRKHQASCADDDSEHNRQFENKRRRIDFI